MTNVSPTSNTNAAQPASQPNSASNRSALSADFNTFLQMLTVQMENQDPLNPMDSAEYAVQLATFSNVEQQVKTNDLLTEMLSRNSSAELSQLAGWIGQDVRATVPMVFEGQTITLSLPENPTASHAELIVQSDSGLEVNRLKVPTSGGLVDWSGLDSSGNQVSWGLYQPKVAFYDSNGELLGTQSVEVYSRVHEARRTPEGFNLVLTGGTIISTDLVSAIRSAN